MIERTDPAGIGQCLHCCGIILMIIQNIDEFIDILGMLLLEELLGHSVDVVIDS